MPISAQQNTSPVRGNEAGKISTPTCGGYDPKLVARYHCEMFRLHDLKQWDALEENAYKMVVALGYDEGKAKKAATFVLEAYKSADLAAKAQQQGKVNDESVAYHHTLDNFMSASRSVGSDTAGLKYKMGWYRSDRHNNPFLVVYYLFREHLQKFGALRLDVVIRTTFVAFWGGYFAHKQHDWKKLEIAMAKYWRYVHDVRPIRPPLQI